MLTGIHQVGANTKGQVRYLDGSLLSRRPAAHSLRAESPDMGAWQGPYPPGNDTRLDAGFRMLTYLCQNVILTVAASGSFDGGGQWQFGRLPAHDGLCDRTRYIRSARYRATWCSSMSAAPVHDVRANVMKDELLSSLSRGLISVMPECAAIKLD